MSSEDGISRLTRAGAGIPYTSMKDEKFRPNAEGASRVSSFLRDKRVWALAEMAGGGLVMALGVLTTGSPWGIIPGALIVGDGLTRIFTGAPYGDDGSQGLIGMMKEVLRELKTRRTS